jgi:hypothetical protein
MSDDHSLEISINPDAGYVESTDGIGAKAKDAFDTLGDLLSEAVEPLRRRLSDASIPADEIEIKLELALKAEGKWVIVSMGSSATVSVKMVWKKPEGKAANV